MPWDGQCYYNNDDYSAVSQRLDNVTDMFCRTMLIVEQEIPINQLLPRDVLNWWEKYQEADKKRLAAEQAKQELEKRRMLALAKLTAEEQRVLGLSGKY